MLKIGCIGFGGPLATMSMMRDELVDRKKLVSSSRYLEGLGVVKLLPGPVSTLLAVFLGQEIAGPLGGLASGLLFILPSFVMLMLIAYFESVFVVLKGEHFRFILQTLQASVIAIILYNCVRLFQDAIKKKYAGETQLFWTSFFAIMAVILAALRLPEIAVLASCSFLSWLVFSKRIALSRSKLQIEPFTIFFVFFFAGLTVFGTGYMVLPYLQRVLVDDRHWITVGQFLDAVTYGNLTPGPVVIASTYMGFKISGIIGALAATAGIFLGPILLMMTLGPVFRKFLGKPWVEGVLLGLLPAVAATIAVSLVVLGRTVSWSPFNIVFALLSGVALLFFKVPTWMVLITTALCAFVFSQFVL